MEKTPNGIIRLHVDHANFASSGGLFHRMHCAVLINFGGKIPDWTTGVSEKGSHKTHWKDKYVDIDAKFVDLTINI